MHVEIHRRGPGAPAVNAVACLTGLGAAGLKDAASLRAVAHAKWRPEVDDFRDIGATAELMMIISGGTWALASANDTFQMATQARLGLLVACSTPAGRSRRRWGQLPARRRLHPLAHGRQNSQNSDCMRFSGREID